jgi:hypothetical protein
LVSEATRDQSRRNTTISEQTSSTHQETESSNSSDSRKTIAPPKPPEMADKSDATENLDELLGDAGVALKGKFTDYFSALTGALDGIKDADTAKAALPGLEELEGSLGGLIGSVKDLPEAARPFFNQMVAGSQKAIADKVTSVLGLPGVEEILKPVLDKIIGLIGGFLKG